MDRAARGTEASKVALERLFKCYSKISARLHNNHVWDPDSRVLISTILNKKTGWSKTLNFFCLLFLNSVPHISLKGDKMGK